MMTALEPIVCRYKDGELMGTLHYRGGDWQMDSAPREPAAAVQWPDDVGLVYFIGGHEGHIKIGWATDPKVRLATLQTASPITLSILAIAGGGRRQEAVYHIRFKAHRVRGEWFERTPELLAEIERLSRPEM